MDMEKHLSDLRMEVEQLKQHVDPAADTKYNALSVSSIISSITFNASTLLTG